MITTSVPWPVPDAFGLVLEGTCPQCQGTLVVRALGEGDRTYADECGWCAPCERGWSAMTWRGERSSIPAPPGDQWRLGEPLVTVYSAGALAVTPRA